MSPHAPGGKAQLRFWLEHQGHRLELRFGENLIGRSASCQLVLEDLLVSREHACITIALGEAVLADRGSANGVFLNGERVLGPRPLGDGDRIDIGKQELVLHSADADLAARSKRAGDETLHGMTAPVTVPRLVPDMTETDATARASVLDMLGGVAEKALALGKNEAAERILEAPLESTLSEAKTGREIDVQTLEKAANYAIRLAAATARPRWVDYTFALYSHCQRPLPSEAVDQLHAVVRSVGQIDLNELRQYIAVLQAGLEGFTPTERFLVQRIEGLERIAALK